MILTSRFEKLDYKYPTFIASYAPNPNDKPESMWSSVNPCFSSCSVLGEINILIIIWRLIISMINKESELTQGIRQKASTLSKNMVSLARNRE